MIAIPHATRGLTAVRHETRQGSADGATFTGATLDGGQLDGINAKKADFTDCSLGGANLNRANLKDAILTGAMMENASVDRCNLEGACMTGAILTGVTLELADTKGADLTGVLRSPGDEALARAEVLAEKALDANAWTESGGVFGEPAVFDGEDLRPLGDRLKDLKLPGLSARHACFAGMDLKEPTSRGPVWREQICVAAICAARTFGGTSERGPAQQG